MPLVSVVMTSYNYSEFITEAINGVLDQDIIDLELIIIDDCSTDGSQDLIKDFCSKDKRVRASFHDKNMGIPKTQNEGISLATGKFIAFCASDDVWLKDKLRRQLEVLKRDENLVVWGEGVIIDKEGNATGQTFTQVYRAVDRKKSGDILEELMKGNFILSTSRMLKRENLGTIRFNEDLKYLNDYQFAVDLASIYHYYFIEKPLVKYRFHGRNTVLREFEGFYWNEIDLRRYFLLTYGDRISNETKATIYSISVNMLKSRLQESVQKMSEMSREISEMNNKISEMTHQISETNHAILEMNQEISEKDHKISDMTYAISERDNEISEMKRSIIWQMAMKYHIGFVERMMPQGTLQREAYDLGIAGGRTLVNEGFGKFWNKTIDYLSKRPPKQGP